jgi:hypothetical protein
VRVKITNTINNKLSSSHRLILIPFFLKKMKFTVSSLVALVASFALVRANHEAGHSFSFSHGSYSYHDQSFSYDLASDAIYGPTDVWDSYLNYVANLEYMWNENSCDGSNLLGFFATDIHFFPDFEIINNRDDESIGPDDVVASLASFCEEGTAVFKDEMLSIETVSWHGGASTGGDVAWSHGTQIWSFGNIQYDVFFTFLYSFDSDGVWRQFLNTEHHLGSV